MLSSSRRLVSAFNRAAANQMIVSRSMTHLHGAITTALPRVPPTAGTKLHDESLANPVRFWDTEGKKRVNWFKPYNSTLDIDSTTGYGTWYSGGKLNFSYNCLDRHIAEGNGDKVALIYDSPVTNVPQGGTVTKFTYKQLLHEVLLLSNYMQSQGITKGDRVVIYMPNIPEAAISMLACARLGAVHSVVFGGFAAPELATRIKDCKPKMILSASCGIDGHKVIDYKHLLDHALELCVDTHKVDSTLIVQRSELPAALVKGRDFDWRQSLAAPAIQAAAKEGLQDPRNKDKTLTEVDANDPLYILYTSGTTGQPKGVVRSNGGYAVALSWSMENVYGMKKDDVFWAASDVGWVVGHSYMVYGPLIHGCTTVLYEGKPIGTPDASNFWRTIERHGVNAMFTAPTAIRAIKRVDEHGKLTESFNLKSLRTLFLAGERADPDSLKWAERSLNVPVRDHWWQTETGWPICGNVVGAEGFIPVKYGSTFRPCVGYDVKIVDEQTHTVSKANTLGKIVVKLPLPPGALNTLYNNDARFIKSYLQDVPGYYDTGDAGYIDEDGYVYIMARTDDVINVAGHRLSSGQMEEVIADHPDVAEVAVVGKVDDFKGQIPLGLIVLNAKVDPNRKGDILKEVIHSVRERIGPVASFKDAVFVERLPKTRSGKVLRATLRAIANDDDYKVPATIEDPAVLTEIAHIIEDYHSKSTA